MTRVAGYCRVSTPQQVQRGESLDAQEGRLRAEADRRGWDLIIYREPGVSAKDDHRPEYRRMRADLEAGKVAGVMATKLDRLWRSLKLAVCEIDLIRREWGRELVVLDQQIDTSTATGRVMLNVLLSFAQFERDVTAERVGEGMRHRAQQGRWNGSPIPYGFRREGPEKGKGKLVVDDQEAETIRWMFDLFLEKQTIRGVCVALNAEGSRTRSGQLWANQTIRRILSSPLYAGVLVYNRRDTTAGRTKRRADGEHIHAVNAVPAIVPAETFDRVQQIRGAWILPPRSQASDYLLAGLLRCERCGGSMAGHASWGRGKKNRHRYYRCYNAAVKGQAACRGNSVRADDLEDRVIECLFDIRVDPDKLRAAVAERKVRSEADAIKREVARLEAELSKIASRENRIMIAYERGDYSVDDMRQRRAEVTADRAGLEAALEKANARLTDATSEALDVDFLVRVLETAFDLYEHLEFDGRRRLLRTLADEVRVGPDGGRISLRNLQGTLESEGGSMSFTLKRPGIPSDLKAWARREAERVYLLLQTPARAGT